MAQWVKLPDNSYIAILHIDRLTVATRDGIQWFIATEMDTGQIFYVRGPFADAAAAQTALDNAVTNNLGGSF